MLHIWGPPLTGKTAFALTLVEQPLLINELEALKKFNPEKHRSIVFDEVELSSLSRERALALVEYEHPRQIHARYADVDIPARTPKIFVSNSPNVFPRDHTGAIASRVATFHASSSLFPREA